MSTAARKSEPVTKDQIRAIQTLRRRIGLDEDTYRDLLERHAGVRSATKLTLPKAVLVIDHLQGLAPERRERPRQAPDRMAGPFAPKLRALWLSAWNLGVVRDPKDAAILAFVKRQTGLSHDRFLHHGEDASKAIEALKAMLTRDGGVHWPGKDHPLRRDADGQENEVLGMKRAIVMAQQRRLVEWDQAEGLAWHRPADLSAAAADAVQQTLGRIIRRVAAAGETA